MFGKAKIEVEKGSDITVMFNPSEYNLDTSVDYSSIKVPGMDSPITQYIAGEQDTLTIQLMFNTYVPPKYSRAAKQVVPTAYSLMTDVTYYTNQIYELTKIDSKLKRPPVCVFKWGSLSFRGVVTNVKQHFTMFLEDGKPVRALVDVTFRSVLDPVFASKQSPFSLSAAEQLKVAVLKAGESLWNIASEAYGDADTWKRIAKANGISNPLLIPEGTRLRIPPGK